MKLNQQRRVFADNLHRKMENNKNIFLIVADLGYKVFDKNFINFPDRCINVGASEQAMVGIAVGLALNDKIPFVYSITNFLLYRPFETLRNYLQYEKIPVKLVGVGRDQDYKDGGVSHWSTDAKRVLNVLDNIKQFWPENAAEIPLMIKEIINNGTSSFISLKR